MDTFRIRAKSMEQEEEGLAGNLPRDHLASVAGDRHPFLVPTGLSAMGKALPGKDMARWAAKDGHILTLPVPSRRRWCFITKSQMKNASG